MENEKLWERVEYAGKLIFTFGISAVLGILIGWWQMQNTAESITKPMATPENFQKIPILSIEKIENGMMKGSSSQEIRITFPSGNTEIMAGGVFSVSVVDILPMLKTLPAPSGAMFVASKSGSKYYPLDHPSAFLLSPKNRVFYFSENDAIKSGKTKVQ